MSKKSIEQALDEACAAVRELADYLNTYDDLTSANVSALGDALEREVESELCSHPDYYSD